MPAPLALAALTPLLMQLLRWLFLAKLASFIGRVAVMLGIGLATNEFLIDPLLEHVEAAWSGVPASLAQWMGALGLDKVISILMSAFAIAGAKQLFLAKQ